MRSQVRILLAQFALIRISILRLYYLICLTACVGCQPPDNREEFQQSMVKHVSEINQQAYERGRRASLAGVAYADNPEMDGPFDSSRSYWASGWVDAMR